MATFQNDQVATIPLIFTNVAGLEVPPVAGGSVGFSDTSVANAVLSSDSSSVTLTPATGTTGSGTLTYTNGSLTCSLSVTYMADVTATAVAFGTPTFSPEVTAG